MKVIAATAKYPKVIKKNFFSWSGSLKLVLK